MSHTMPKTKSYTYPAWIKVRGRDAYRKPTEKEIAAIIRRKQLAEQRKFYRQFGLKVSEKEDQR